MWWCPVAQLVPSVLEVVHANAAIFPPHPVLNEKREGAGGHPCRIDISLRSCCGRRGTVAFFTSQYVLVIKKEKNSNKIQHSVEREAAPTGEDSSFFFFT